MEHEPTKFFFREKHATNFILKGNFMTLAAQPKHVELGEWLAHQGRFQSRTRHVSQWLSFHIQSWNKIVSSLDCFSVFKSLTATLGLPYAIRGLARQCPLDGKLSCYSYEIGLIGLSSHTYTWLNNDKTPIKVPACQYIGLVQKWIVGKIHDPRIFPTDSSTIAASTYASGGMNTPGSTTPIAAGPTTLNTPLSALAGNEWVGKPSGFPESFLADCKNITRQMFRCYAHLYHAHWENPFYHLGMDKQLNSCFVHFMTVAMLYKLLSEKDLEPMQPLIDIWLASGAIPPDAAAGAGVLGPAIPS